MVYSDASVKSHHGAGIGWHIQTWATDQDNILETIETGRDFLSDQYTSEEAELLALTRAVKEALRLDGSEYLRLRIDCKPLVEKVQNRESIKDGKYIDSLYRLLDRAEEWSIKWVSRDQNTCADRQAVTARDQQT